MSQSHQLVLEFEVESVGDFDRIVGYEDLLRDALGCDCVDGHDAGQGVMNIFILTDDPVRCFSEAMRVLDGAERGPVAAGYRPRGEHEYARIWPASDHTPFTLR